jgi:SAM-dependent methyltransferase
MPLPASDPMFWTEGSVADTMAGMITDWLAFWDSSHSIYVNARHKDVHYRLIAKEIAALVPGADTRVLDYGSGEALHADLVAQVAGELLLCEAAPGVREALAQRFAGNAKIDVLAPHEAARLPEHSLDLVVLHSVLQYLTPTAANALFSLFHRLLKPGGILVVGDVIGPEVPAATDAMALLRFGSANGFLLDAAWGLVRTMFSHYSRLRAQLGLTRYAKTAMIEKLSAAGFEAQLAPHNIGHNQARWTYYARPR